MVIVILTSIILPFISQLLVAGESRIIISKKNYIIYNILSVFLVYSLLNIFLWNYEINFLIITTFTYILSLVMFFVHEFRGTNLNFSDILSINTAKEVAGGYRYNMKKSFIAVFLIICFEYIYIIIFKGIDVFGNYHKVINGISSRSIDIYRYFWHELGHIIIFFITFFILRDKISSENYDYSLFAGEKRGYIYSFMSSIPIFHKIRVHKVDNMTTTTTKKLKRGSTKNLHLVSNMSNINIKYNNYVNKNEGSAHIIVIMNESFGSIQERIKTNIKVTPYFDILHKVTKGNLYVNTFGGGTANTEFEFLTGMTIGNYPYPVMPYNNFVKKTKYSIARYLKNLGYKTFAMHPYTPSNYHRNKVYKRFGFDELLFFKDVKEKHYVRKYISDECMYNEIIRRYRMVKLQGNKMFLFGVTMQNHSGYRDFKEGKVMSLIETTNGREELDGYLSLIRISDYAIRTLINYFNKEKEHVIILFFGDHNASFGTELNRAIYGDHDEYFCSDAYKVPFFIYDNKAREKKYIESISANFLSLELLKQAGLPLDKMHELMNNTYKKSSTYNFYKAYDNDSKRLVDIPDDELMMLEKEYLK